MSSKTPIANEFAQIAARQAEIKREEDKAKFGEMPQVNPDFTSVDEVYGTMYESSMGYLSPDKDPA